MFYVISKHDELFLAVPSKKFTREKLCSVTTCSSRQETDREAEMKAASYTTRGIACRLRDVEVMAKTAKTSA